MLRLHSMGLGEVSEDSRKKVIQIDLITSYIKRLEDLPEKYISDRIISSLRLYLEYSPDRHNQDTRTS